VVQNRVVGPHVPAALTPRAAFMSSSTHGLHTLTVLDRETGHVRQLPPDRDANSLRLAIARDVIYGPRGGVYSSTISAHRFDDQLLWEIDLDLALERTGAIGAIAALDRSLFVEMDDGTILALTDLPESVWPTKR